MNCILVPDVNINNANRILLFVRHTVFAAWLIVQRFDKSEDEDRFDIGCEG